MLESVAVVTAMEKQGMVSSFLEIAVGQSAETARQFLEATSWKLEEAIQLFYVGNEEKPHSSSSSRVAPAAVNKDSTTTARNDDIDHDDPSPTSYTCYQRSFIWSYVIKNG
ncbi:hypothetical protein Syun_017710 [Stephania yunnanensis]|uniref:Uncharacterized protein n=1 Tax=Stephania yunnanensis TaxID=152371 RepID=A0AAP0J9Q4_9MAGN